MTPEQLADYDRKDRELIERIKRKKNKRKVVISFQQAKFVSDWHSTAEEVLKNDK